MTGTGKSYTVKTWFANKVAQEMKRNINMCDVFAILKETEKAVYAVLKIGCRVSKTMWVPKSVLIESPVGRDEQEFMHYETIRCGTYEEAMLEYKLHWDLFD